MLNLFKLILNYITHKRIEHKLSYYGVESPNSYRKIMNAVHTDKFGRKNGSGKLVPGAIIYNYGKCERKKLNMFDFLRIF